MKPKKISQTSIKFCLIQIIFLNLVTCNIWDNIFSQTQASHPITLSQSFNIDFSLPEAYSLDGNIDFNSQLKILTLTLSKDLLIQKIDFIKAQIDFSELILNMDQFLIGCEKFTLGLDDAKTGDVKKRIQGANLNKKQMFLVNLLFKYIGKSDGNVKDSSKIEGINQKKDQIEAGFLDIFKGNKIFDSIADSGVFGDLKNDHSSSGNKNNKSFNMFEFAIDLYKDPKQLINKLKQSKQKAEKDLDIDSEQFGDFDLQNFDFDLFKFVILADQKTGQIVKAFKNRELKQELEFSLKSKQTKKVICKKEAKKLTMEDLTNGAKYLYENKDSFESVLNN